MPCAVTKRKKKPLSSHTCSNSNWKNTFQVNEETVFFFFSFLMFCCCFRFIDPSTASNCCVEYIDTNRMRWTLPPLPRAILYKAESVEADGLMSHHVSGGVGLFHTYSRKKNHIGSCFPSWNAKPFWIISIPSEDAVRAQRIVRNYSWFHN